MQNKFYIKSKSGKFVEIDPNRNLQIIYTKDGDQYTPSRERIDWLDYYANGDYYVSVKAGGRSMTTKVYPDKKKLHAAFNSIKDRLSKEIVEASKLHLDQTKKLTKKEVEAYEVFLKTLGKKAHMMWFSATQDIVNKMEQWILEAGEKDELD